MDPALGRPLVVVNPHAGRGTDETLRRLVAALSAAGCEVDVAATAGRGDATRVAREAVDAGREYLVVVGGDGTTNEVVNGLIDAGTGTARGSAPVLAVVGGGSGSDLVRTFGLDRAPERLVPHLLSEAIVHLDVGRATFADGSQRLFVNVAEVGYGGRVAQLANRLPRRLGQARYAAAIVASVATFRRVETTVVHDGGTTSESLCNVIVANAQFFGGGLHVAPRALPTDGRFNVQAWGGSPIDVLRAQPQLRRGTHLSRPDVREWQSAAVEVTAASPLVVEADGEVIGSSPVRFDLLPGALRFKL